MAEADQVLAVVRYCARELKIQHIFIDNLAKCVRGEDDYNGQKLFVDRLFAAARDENIHIHLVHHLRKGSKETDFIDKNDFKGSGSVTDQPDNLIGVWRNKPKENDVKVKGSASKFFDEADVVLKVFKQRNYDGSTDDEPMIQLWFDRESWQYKAQPRDRLIDFEDIGGEFL
jgi:twinkle protein